MLPTFIVQFYLQCTNLSQFKICFGITSDLFETILQSIGFSLIQRSLNHGEKEKEKTGAPRIHSLEDQLKLFLHWLRYYLPEEYLSA